MTRQIRLLLTVCCVAFVAQAYAADWPQYLGPTANGIAPDKGINKNWAQKPPKVLWQVALGDDGFAGPSAAEGKVFIIDHAGSQDIVRAIDLTTGQDAWRFAYDDTDQSNYGFARSTPTYSEGKLYTLGRMGQLFCLDAKTGQKIWGTNIQQAFGGLKPQWDYAASPLVDGDRVIVEPGGRTNTVALNKNTGQVIWQGGGAGVAGYATPVAATINGVKEYVVFTGKTCTGIRAQDGRLQWTIPWKTEYDVNAPTPIVVGNLVFLTSGYNSGCALCEITPAQGIRTLWISKDISPHFNSPIYYNDFIFAVSEDFFVCLNGQTGGANWQQFGFGKGSVIGVDGVLIALDGKDGNLVMAEANPKAYRELGRIKPLGGQSWTMPIIADGKLIVRNQKGMMCLDLM